MSDSITPPVWGTTEFVPGAHVGLVGRDLFGLVEAGHEVVRDELWLMVVDGVGLDSILDHLASSGLRALPSFAIVVTEGDQTRVVARGAAIVTIEGRGGDVRRIDPAEVTTWIEEVVSDVSAVTVTLAEAAATEEPSRSGDFHVLAGSIPACLLRRTFIDTAPFATSAEEGWRQGPGRARQRGAADDSSDPSEEDRHGSTTRTEHPSHEWSESDDDDDPEVEGAPQAGDPDSEAASPPRSTAHDDGSDETLVGDGVRDEVGDGSGGVSTGVGEFDDLFGHTIVRSVEAAAMRGAGVTDDDRTMIETVPSGDPVVDASGMSPPAGDHDGLTVSRASLAASRTVGRPGEVVAAFCELSHANPPQQLTCRVCGRPVSANPSTVDRPPLGVLAFSNGERVLVDRTILIGRNPKVVGSVTGEMPRLVKVGDARDGLSRTHAEIRVEGWQMLLEDLRSTNGTEVRLPGQVPRKLRAGEPVVIPVGTFVDLGEELQCTVEEVHTQP